LWKTPHRPCQRLRSVASERSTEISHAALKAGALLEREPELAELRHAAQAAVEGRGRVVVLEGAAGAGKSALLSAARDDAPATGLRVLSARGSELERGYAFGVVRRLLEPALVAAPDTERRRLVAGVAAPAASVLAPGDDHAGPGVPGAAGFPVLNALAWFVANLAARGPLLLAVDDLHWADTSSLRALGHLAARIPELPVVLLVALRPSEPGTPAAVLEAVAAAPGALTIDVRPLGIAAVSALVRERLDGADDDLCEACHAATAGNPLYVRELVRALAAEDELSALAVRRAAIPSLADRVARRIARLGPDVPGLTRAMAVLGDGGRLATAARLAGQDEARAATAALGLRRIEILAGEDPFEFVHPLVRRSVYDQLSVTERDSAHRAAAALLRDEGAAPELVAAHLAAVRPAGDSAAAATFAAAALQARARAAPEAAMAWLERALTEDAPAPARATLLAELGFAEVTAWNAAAVEHLREAHETSADPLLRARVTVALAETLLYTGRWDEGRALIESAVERSGDEDPETVAELMAYWAVTTFFDSRLAAEFERLRERFGALAAGASWPAHALSAMLASAAAIRGDRLPDVVPLAEQALASGRLLTERGAGEWTAAQIIGALITVEEDERAEQVWTVVSEEARRCGSIVGAITATAFRSAVAARRGDLVAAEADLRTSLEIMQQADIALALTTIVWLARDAILERRSCEDVAALVEATELPPDFLATWGGAQLLEVRGLLRLAAGDRAGAVADLRAHAGTCEALRVGPLMDAWRTALARALPPEAADEARALAAEELRLARASGFARPVGVALRAEGMLAGGDEGLDRLDESVTVLEPDGARLELARSLVELGAALRRRGRRLDGRAPLERGMELAHRCGADRLCDRAREELLASGARPRRFVRTGVDALTPTELRVARMAASGRSNAEIAQELYVSLKTVETHLYHAYGKLDLAGQGSRRALAAALGDRG
jgi:DNA-binding CsgD family transcriptional regulator